jgi:hypothetical protein
MLAAASSGVPAHFELPLSTVLPNGQSALGRRATKPVERETVLTPTDVSFFFAAGAACSSTAHALLTPLDVVKTRMQVMSI